MDDQEPADDLVIGSGGNGKSGNDSYSGNPKQQGQPTPHQIIDEGKPLPVIPIIAIAVILVIGGAAFLFLKGYILAAPTTTSTSTILSSVSPISGCQIIARSGKYFVPSDIKTAIQGGACINVSASNVNIACDNSRIVGSGPFLIVPPFTYGIQIMNDSNVTVTGCKILNFSYGIYSVSSNGVGLSNNNVSLNFVSNIYLNNTHNSTVRNNYMSKASSTQGSMFLTNGTSGITVLNNTIQYNNYYGININASNNTFIDNFLNGTQYSFRCSVPNSFPISSRASGNVCANSTGCGFLECRSVNIPANISKLVLSSRISSCGSVVNPGTYELASDIDMRNFINISNILSVLTPCIRVASKNVVINCNGFGIYNSTVAVSSSGIQNVTIKNCKINNADVGILLNGATSFSILNTSFKNEGYGIEMYNSSLNDLLNVTVTSDTNAVLLSSSFSNLLQDVRILNNTYGVYLQNNSYSNTFNKATILNNSKMDVFATQDSANISYNLMSSTTCGYTTAQWATCKHFIGPAMAYVPFSECGTISQPGNYILQSSIANGYGQCIHITASNVTLSCAGHVVSAGPTIQGPGMMVSDAHNVTINNCDFLAFPTSVNVTHSSLVTLEGIGSHNSNYGIVLDNVENGGIYNSSVNATNNASIMLYNTSNVRITNAIVSYGQKRNIALLVNNSQNNTIDNSIASHNYIGMELSGKSSNNTIMNNTMQSDTKLDYMCIGNGGIDSEKGGINYGTTKSGCHWLAAITPIHPKPECIAASEPSLLYLTQDYEYTTGSTCFTLFANTSTINCNGHTIIATSGGTFAEFKNSQDSRIENCYLKDFADTITATNSTVTVFNNTVYESAPGSIAIHLNDSRLGVTVQSNNVSTSGTGIYLSNIGSGSLEDNLVSRANTAYYLHNVTAMTIKGDTAYPGAYFGLILNDSLTNILQNNNMFSSGTGISCLLRSQGRSNNTDLGNNACNSQSNCLWLQSSSQQCP
ncbi:MAG: right-handed parallel beta-helix repeat-containing protein [Candidatus Micrarchaeota archaeon]|nr:right-handed parallel beta-helix repeat-containing protein [Candidatus Micrarchaeota archaeon]